MDSAIAYCWIQNQCLGTREKNSFRFTKTGKQLFIISNFKFVLFLKKQRSSFKQAARARHQRSCKTTQLGKAY